MHLSIIQHSALIIQNSAKLPWSNPRYEALDGNRLKGMKLSTQGAHDHETDFAIIRPPTFFHKIAV
jgi:hypothetical protein